MVNTHHRIRMLREERGLTISALAEKQGFRAGRFPDMKTGAVPVTLQHGASWLISFKSRCFI